MTLILKPLLGAVFVALAYSTLAATAQPSIDAKEDAMQLKSDKASLQRQVKRLDADEARLKADTAAGRMSAESKDAFAIYQSRKAVTGEKSQIGIDQEGSLQMKSDKDALQRQIKRLELAEARLKADTGEGKMAAESRDGEKVLKDKESVTAEKKAIATDKSNMKAAEKK